MNKRNLIMRITMLAADPALVSYRRLSKMSVSELKRLYAWISQPDPGDVVFNV